MRRRKLSSRIVRCPHRQAGEAARQSGPHACSSLQQRTSLGLFKTRRRLCQNLQLSFIVTYTTYIPASMQCHRSKSNLPTWREQVVRSPSAVDSRDDPSRGRCCNLQGHKSGPMGPRAFARPSPFPVQEPCLRSKALFGEGTWRTTFRLTTFDKWRIPSRSVRGLWGRHKPQYYDTQYLCTALVTSANPKQERYREWPNTRAVLSVDLNNRHSADMAGATLISKRGGGHDVLRHEPALERRMLG